MDGWNTSCLLGRPIFRGEMLVSGSVFRWVFDQVSSEHEKILCLKKLEGARFLLLDMLETHRLISPWMRLGPHSRNWPTAPRTIVGAGPGPKTLVSQRTWHQQSPLSNPWHENSRIKRILSNGELVVKILPWVQPGVLICETPTLPKMDWFAADQGQEKSIGRVYSKHRLHNKNDASE